MDNRKEKTGPLKRMAIRIALARMAKKLKTYLKDSEMKDWKTTIAGAVLAAVVAVQPIVESGNIDWKDLAFAALIAAFGYLAGDKQTTGTKVK